jgi:hypothetical protein
MTPGGQLLDRLGLIFCDASTPRRPRPPRKPPCPLMTLTEIREVHRLAMTPVWDVAPHPDTTANESPGSFREHDISTSIASSSPLSRDLIGLSHSRLWPGPTSATSPSVTRPSAAGWTRNAVPMGSGGAPEHGSTSISPGVIGGVDFAMLQLNVAERSNFTASPSRAGQRRRVAGRWR